MGVPGRAVWAGPLRLLLLAGRGRVPSVLGSGVTSPGLTVGPEQKPRENSCSPSRAPPRTEGSTPTPGFQ